MKRLILTSCFTVLFMHGTAFGQWDYSQQQDKMGRGTIKHATATSLNEVTFNFPYGGAQRAQLALRIHPEYGRNVILNLRKAHFLCNSLDGCTVLVRFDDRKAERFRATGPADHSTNTLFISDYSRFLRGLTGAKVVRIEAPFYQEATRVFEFSVTDLKWQQPAAPKRTATPTAAQESSPDDYQKAMQQKMKACSAQATEQRLRGYERKAFISDCMKN